MFCQEIPFETSDEVPWPHIPFWEEVIFPGLKIFNLCFVFLADALKKR